MKKAIRPLQPKSGSQLAVPEEVIMNKIYYIRGHKVMLDRDLAELYQVETKRLKEQVKRNIERFPAHFMFELTKEENEILRSQIAVLSEIIYKEAIRLFAPELTNRITIKSEKSAGASWVTRQLVIWSHSLHLDNNKNYVKAIGIYDGDMAGKDAIQELNRIVKNDGIGSKTYKTISLTANHAQQLIPLFQKGVIIPITFEELFDSDLWNFALEKGWIEPRKNPEEILKDPKSWDKYNHSFKDFIQSLKLLDKEAIYLNKFKKENKDDFSRHLVSLCIESEKSFRQFRNIDKRSSNLHKLR